jgi:hypothetical protein
MYRDVRHRQPAAEQVEGELDVAGGEGNPVVPADVRPERDFPESVVRGMFPRLRQPRARLAGAGVHDDERLEHHELGRHVAERAEHRLVRIQHQHDGFGPAGTIAGGERDEARSGE